MSDRTWTRLRAEAVRGLPGVPLASGYQVQDAQGRRYDAEPITLPLARMPIAHRLGLQGR